MESVVDFILCWIGLGVIFFLYFIPAIVAWDKKNRDSILVLNLFLGWTFVGWVIALVWACKKED